MNLPLLPSPWHLRPLRLADEAAVMNIDTLRFPSPWKSAGFIYELTQNELASYLALVQQAETGLETLIGYAGYWLIADEVHISTLAIHPEWGRQGLGELLWLALLLSIPQPPASSIYLEVRRHNRPAFTLYQKYQFLVVGERHGYYKDTGEDALLMSLPAFDAAYRQQLSARWTEWSRKQKVSL